MPEVFSVTNCIGRLTRAIESQVGAVWVEGEVVNLSKSPVGHWYFSIKDEKSSLNCAFFKFDAMGCRELQALKDGDKIKIHGRAGIYSARGSLQIVVKRLVKSGRGNLVEEFEKLKRRLAAEGLFDPETKKEIPKLPERVGVITAPESAAFQDFLNVYKRRSFKMDIELYPSLVQGNTAPEKLRAALEHAIRDGMGGRIDAIVITRGGGASEDLWCFNDEGLAWDIYNSPIPIISAIGHQVDFTICDFVADKRCETPTAAAQELTEYQVEVLTKMKSLGQRMQFIGSNLFNSHRSRLRDSSPQSIVNTIYKRFLAQKERFNELGAIKNGAPLLGIDQKNMHLDDLMRRLSSEVEYVIESKKQNLSNLNNLLNAFAPQNTLQRGYCYAESSENKVLKSIKDFEALEQESQLSVVFYDGKGTVKKT
jgi:exodeoxyribonuclease VII large subunit